MTSLIAKGSFEVTLDPGEGPAPTIAVMTINKTFTGDLTGTSQGAMFAVRTAIEGSAGYVAIEQVTATLDGKSGSFALQHMGRMDRGESTLQVRVVPDSATNDLIGLRGGMEIDVTADGHFYVFEYSFAPPVQQ